MTTRYYQKEKCRNCLLEAERLAKGLLIPLRICRDCQGKGFTRGADLTELINRIQQKVDLYFGLGAFKIEEDLIEVVEE